MVLPPATHRQSFLAIRSLDPLVIAAPTSLTQHQIEHRTAPTAASLGQLAKPLAQLKIAIWRRCPLETAHERSTLVTRSGKQQEYEVVPQRPGSGKTYHRWRK